MGRGIKLKNETYVCPYFPVGSIYMSVVDLNPSNYFGGTWEKITSDAYLKIVGSNAGQLGGTSNEHKIPIESMPTHNHRGKTGMAGWMSSQAHIQWVGSGQGYRAYDNLDQGGGQPYYPYYLGVYVWKRTA